MVKAISFLKQVFKLPFKLFDWFCYLGGGCFVHFVRYLVLRNVWVFHDLFHVLIAVLRFEGKSLSRLAFTVRNRFLGPKSFWHGLKSFNSVSSPLPHNWDSIRKSVLDKDNYECTVCEAKNTELHVDHIKPRKWNGSHNFENLRTLCRHCHICRHFRKL